MGVLDFLKPKKGSPDSQIAAMESSLEKLRSDRRQLQEIIDSHGSRRAAMMLSDSTAADIDKLDTEVRFAKIDLDRLELVELELADRIDRARDKADRERRAAEAERAASVISSKTAAVDEAATALATAFAALVETIPVDLIDVTSRKDGFMVDLPASPTEVARAIVAQSLATQCPDLFENRPSTRLANRASIEKFLSVAARDSHGRLSQILEGERGEFADISTADVAAGRIIVNPLREIARELRADPAADAMLEAAE